MTLFVPTSSGATADALSEALWQLSSPNKTLETTSLFMRRLMLDGSTWLVVDTELVITVHKDADMSPIIGILEPWVDGGFLDASEMQALVDAVENARGGELNAWSAFPEFFKERSKHEAELISLGLIIPRP